MAVYGSMRPHMAMRMAMHGHAMMRKASPMDYHWYSIDIEECLHTRSVFNGL